MKKIIFVAFLGWQTSFLFGVEVERVNTTSVKLYEKFEAVIDLDGVVYSNPYDPDKIDVSAVFTAPSGMTWPVFGFYDDYRGVSEWKVRFAPNETGVWNYVITARDQNGSAQSSVHQFSAVASEHHGWIHVSAENPHYMEHDDGSSFFGVGMYTPWGNSVDTFDRLKSYGGNTFAIWNITYGGMVNGYGLIEEELGRYNQTKCGKIDTLIAVAEDRDLTFMYCFWPHDLFSATVWAHQWHLNPYHTICDVEDVYSDSLCWEYQKKQYRYLIARFAYSRSWGIWEIMNEINGTDGWAAGRREEAKEWVHKVDTYFKENDPYQHPTTASRSGGSSEYWPEMYELVDLSNIHVYESQGWTQSYRDNALRSSVKNYADATTRFWNGFDQPGIFGEAGADLVTVDIYSPDYTAMYHNAIWASLTNGLSAIPYWWTFTNPIRDVERIQMFHLSEFVADIDFIKESRAHFEVIGDDFDLYGMSNDSTAFGWIRDGDGSDVSGVRMNLKNVLNPGISVCAIRYFDPWTGEDLGTRIRPHVDRLFREIIPDFGEPLPDVAFKITPAQGGDIPARLELSADSYLVWNFDTTLSVSCYLLDDQDWFCPQASGTVIFALTGPGTFSDSPEVTVENGVATIPLHISDESGVVQIVATSAGLSADTLSILVQDRFIVDNFESYDPGSSLSNIWSAKSGTTAETFLDVSQIKSGAYGMRMEYSLGTGFRPTSVIEKQMAQDFSGSKFLSFWIKPDGSGREVEVRLVYNARYYWTYFFDLTGSDSTTLTIPIEEFAAKDASFSLDLSALTALRLTIRKGDGTEGSGALYFDDFKFLKTGSSAIEKTGELPGQFTLSQNYPNPFNLSTKIEYTVPHRGRVNLTIYNPVGQKIETLVDQDQDVGKHAVVWNASNAVSSGVYIYRIRAGDYKATRKSLLIK